MIYLFIIFCDLELDGKEDNGALYEMVDEDDKVKEPDESMMFSSWEELHSYY
jgi:hypothetical protein